MMDYWLIEIRCIHGPNHFPKVIAFIGSTSQWTLASYKLLTVDRGFSIIRIHQIRLVTIAAYLVVFGSLVTIVE